MGNGNEESEEKAWYEKAWDWAADKFDKYIWKPAKKVFKFLVCDWGVKIGIALMIIGILVAIRNPALGAVIFIIGLVLLVLSLICKYA